MRALVSLNKLNDHTGSETYCLGLVRRLVERGWTVDVFALYSSPAMEERVAALGGRLYTYPSFPAVPPDRVVTMHPLATSLTVRRVESSVPTVCVVHGVTADEMPARPARIDRYVAVSPFVADELTRRHGIVPEHVVVVPNGVDLRRFDAAPVARPPDPVRLLWPSTYIPLRHAALRALVTAVERLEHTRLTVVADHLPPDVVPATDRIEVVAKSARIEELIERCDVVAGLGPGRILLEGLAMNRAALALNVRGRGEFLTEANRARLEYYLEDWGSPVEDLLEPGTVFEHQNLRAVAERLYDEAANLDLVIGHLEAVPKRRRSPARYYVSDLRRARLLARSYRDLVSGRRAAARQTATRP